MDKTTEPNDPRREIDFSHELLEIGEIREIVLKEDGTMYNHAVIAGWARRNLFASKVMKYSRPLIPRWAVESFTPPEQSGKTWIRRPDYAKRRQEEEQKTEYVERLDSFKAHADKRRGAQDE